MARSQAYTVDGNDQLQPKRSTGIRVSK